MIRDAILRFDEMRFIIILTRMNILNVQLRGTENRVDFNFILISMHSIIKRFAICHNQNRSAALF